MSDWDRLWTIGEADDFYAVAQQLRDLQAAQAENEATIAAIESGWKVIAQSEEDAANQVLSYEEAAAYAYQSVQSKIEALCEAYD